MVFCEILSNKATLRSDEVGTFTKHSTLIKDLISNTISCVSSSPGGIHQLSSAQFCSFHSEQCYQRTMCIPQASSQLGVWFRAERLLAYVRPCVQFPALGNAHSQLWNAT